jgi:hypothetical protein
MEFVCTLPEWKGRTATPDEKDLDKSYSRRCYPDNAQMKSDADANLSILTPIISRW